MDYQEAIEILREGIETFEQIPHLVDAYKTAISAMQELWEYKHIGTLEEVRTAVEKQKAKKPAYDGDGYAPDGTFVWDEWICPNCGHRYEIDYEEHDYCPYCGQRIDWSDNDRK